MGRGRTSDCGIGPRTLIDVPHRFQVNFRVREQYGHEYICDHALGRTVLCWTVHGDITAAPCEVQLKRPVPTCPAVTYSPDDCDSSTLSGKKGDKFYPNIINIMSSGHVYACAPRDTCSELKDLIFRGCKFEFKDRLNGESPNICHTFSLI